MSSLTRPRSVPSGGLARLDRAALQARYDRLSRRHAELANLLPVWHPTGSKAHWNGRALRQEQVRLHKELAILERAIAAVMSSPDS